MDTRYLDRLRRARDLLSVTGYQTAETVLACYSGTGFSQDLKTPAANEPRILLVGLDRLYSANEVPLAEELDSAAQAGNRGALPVTGNQGSGQVFGERDITRVVS